MGNPNQPRDSKGRWTKGGGTFIVTTAAAFGAVSLSGGVVGEGAGAGTSADSAIGKTVRAKVEKEKDSASKGHRDAAWRKLGLKRLRQSVQRAAGCALHAHGEVREFFLHTPCRSLKRMIFALADGNGNTVVVSVVWVTMYSANNAQRFTELIDTDGSGDIYPLAGSLVNAAGVRFTGKHYDSRTSGKLAVIAETEPLSGSPDTDFLDGIANVAAQFPPP